MKEKIKNIEYPCSFPFEQLYVVPRSIMDIRFCCYHDPIILTNQEEILQKGYKYLEELFNTHPSIVKQREIYIKGDFKKAKCNEGCYCYNVHKMTGKGFQLENYTQDNKFKLKQMWLSVGPDCNATCRYCLDPENFYIDYNTCDPRIMDLAYEFVKDGGYVLLTGGETFLPKFRFLEILKKLSEEKDVQGYFNCHTNGAYLDKKARDIILKSPLRTLNVSIDTFRPELFNYLRRGLDFEKVFSNIKSLIKERDEANLKSPHVNILCTLLAANCDHIIETADAAVDMGCTMSINGLFIAPNSPDFSREQGMQNLSLKELEKVCDDLQYITQKHGYRIAASSMIGQLRAMIEEIKTKGSATQVALGGGCNREIDHKKRDIVEKYLTQKASGRKIYLWGSGQKGWNALKMIKNTKLEIEGFIDSNENKTGQKVLGKNVYHSSTLEKMPEKPFILITSIFFEEIMNTLNKMGYKKNKDYAYFEDLK